MKILNSIKKYFGKLVLAGSLVVGPVTASLAAIAPADMALVTTAVNDATADFYKLGGIILAVIAGIWAFYKVVSLLSKKG